ncbi:hypothetical protein AAC387_Pa02g1990 [Persea americana]
MGDLLGSPRVAPPFCFSRQFGPSLLGRRSPPPLVILLLFFCYRGNHCSAINNIEPAAAGVLARGVGTMGMGRTGPKTVVLASRMAQFDHAGGSKRACLLAPSISPSRAFRRYFIKANRAGGSKVGASTRQACPQEPPFFEAQIVSSADILRVRSYQR